MSGGELRIVSVAELLKAVELGVVASLNRPGGNITGVAMMGVELEAKRFERLREFVPTAALIAMLVNPDNAQFEMQSRAVQEAARGVGQPFLILHARNESEIDTAFAVMAEQRAGALVVGADTYFTSQPALLVALSARYRIPTIYAWREHVVQGGLMSYATNLTEGGEVNDRSATVTCAASLARAPVL